MNRDGFPIGCRAENPYLDLYSKTYDVIPGSGARRRRDHASGVSEEGRRGSEMAATRATAEQSRWQGGGGPAAGGAAGGPRRWGSGGGGARGVDGAARHQRLEDAVSEGDEHHETLIRLDSVAGLSESGLASATPAQRGGGPQQASPLRTAIFDPQQKIYYADANDRTVRALPVRDNVWMIVGAGGNIIVQTGDDGVLVVDTGSGGAATEKVQTILRAISTKPIRYILNTSFRPDHTGGNESARHARLKCGRRRGRARRRREELRSRLTKLFWRG